MTTPDPWYEVVAAEARLSQGDVILDCPILGWASPAATVELGTPVDLTDICQVGLRDVVVMTQACDLEHNCDSARCTASTCRKPSPASSCESDFLSPSPFRSIPNPPRLLRTLFMWRAAAVAVL